MPAQSQQQQKLFGLALAFKRGEVPSSEVSDEIKAIADRMSEKDIEDFAATKHKGLPKMKEQLRKIVREIMRERAISEMSEQSVTEGRKSKDGWGVRLVIAIHTNVQTIVELVMYDKRDPKEVISAFANPLLNSVKGASKHNYKPNAKPAYTSKRELQRYGDLTNQQRLDIFKSEIKKFEKIVEALIKKPTKVGVKQLDDAWRTIWNHKYGANIGLNGEGPHANTIIEVSSHTTKESVNENDSYSITDDKGRPFLLIVGEEPKDSKGKSEYKKNGFYISPQKGFKGLITAYFKDEKTLRKNIDKKYHDQLGESVNEAASRTAMEIGGLTGMNKDAIQKFVDTNELDIEKVFQFVKKGKLKDRMDLVSAIAGKPNNPVQKKMIKMFKESVNEGASTEEKKIVMMAIKKIAKYRNVPLHFAVNDVIRAAEELERTIGKK